MAHTVSLTKGKTFHILGVIHRDKSNGKIVINWLNTIRPQVITLEFSQYGLMFRKERGYIYRNKIESVLTQMRQSGEIINEEALSCLNAYVDLPSEYEAASLYCSENGASLHLVDMDFFSYMNLKDVDEVFSEKNIRSIIGTQDGHTSTHERVMARLFFQEYRRSPIQKKCSSVTDTWAAGSARCCKTIKASKLPILPAGST
jgi:hypothetical protein